MSIDEAGTGGKRPESLSGAQLEAMESFRKRLQDVLDLFREKVEQCPSMGKAERTVLLRDTSYSLEGAVLNFQERMRAAP